MTILEYLTSTEAFFFVLGVSFVLIVLAIRGVRL